MTINFSSLFWFPPVNDCAAVTSNSVVRVPSVLINLLKKFHPASERLPADVVTSFLSRALFVPSTVPVLHS